TLCAAGRHHQSERILAWQFHRSRDLGRGRRPRHAHRRGPRRCAGQLRQDLFHQRTARALLAVHARWAVHRGDVAVAPRRRRHRAAVVGKPHRAHAGGAKPRGKWRRYSCASTRAAARGVSAMNDLTAGSMLYLDGVSVSFDGFKALNNLSLTVAPGEMRAIIGPNGAGKTTMLNVV